MTEAVKPWSREEIRQKAFAIIDADTLRLVHKACATFEQTLSGASLTAAGCTGVFYLPASGMGNPIDFDTTLLCDVCHERLIPPSRN